MSLFILITIIIIIMIMTIYVVSLFVIIITMIVFIIIITLMIKYLRRVFICHNNNYYDLNYDLEYCPYCCDRPIIAKPTPATAIATMPSSNSGYANSPRIRVASLYLPRDFRFRGEKMRVSRPKAPLRVLCTRRILTYLYSSPVS